MAEDIFVSHSSKDKELLKQYEERIKEFGFKSYFFSSSDDTGIEHGEDWEKKLYYKLKNTKVLLCLISKNWTDSCWCQKEFSIARTLGKEVIAASIEVDEYKKAEVYEWIGKNIHQLDITKDDENFEKILEKIKKLSRILDNKPYLWDEHINPYPGLEAFDEDKAAVFFGREDEIEEIVADLQGIYHKANTRAYIVMGASGMGKSSLLKAGVLPQLKVFEEYRDKWEVLDTFRPQKKPFVTFLAQMLQFVNMGDDFDAIYGELTSGKERTYLDKLIRQLILKQQSKNILFPIDQAEEFFTISHKEEKMLFFKLLTILMGECSKFYTIWTMRSDYIGVFQGDEVWGAIQPYHTTKAIAPLKKEEIRKIIKNPAEKSDLMIEGSLIERLKNDLQDTKALPLLAYTLNELAKPFFKNHIKTQGIITIKDYENLAKGHENPIYMIIEKKIDEIFKNKHQIDANLTDEKLEALLKELFIYHLIDVKFDGNIAKKSAQSDTLSSNTQKVIQHFTDERLLVSKQQDGENVIEIAHESIITNWKLLQKWIDEEKEFLIFRSQLELFYDEWVDIDKDDKALLNGLSLEKATKYKSKINNKSNIIYINKSIILDSNKRTKKRNIVIGVLATISLLLFLSIWQWIEVKHELIRSQHNMGRALLSDAKVALSKNKIVEANLYASHALQKLNKTYDKTGAITQAKGIIFSNPFTKKVFQIKLDSPALSMSIAPDNKTIAILSKNGQIEIWSIITGTLLKKYNDLHQNAVHITISNDGKSIISTSEKKLIYWDYKQGTILKKVTLNTFHDEYKKLFDLSKTPLYGRIYAIGEPIKTNGSNYLCKFLSTENTLIVWDIKKKKFVTILKNITPYFDISKNGKYLMYKSTEDKKNYILDIENNTTNYLYNIINKNNFSQLELSTDSDTNAIVLLYLKDNIESFSTIQKHLTDNIEISNDKKTIATNSNNKIINIWDRTSTFYGNKYSLNDQTYIDFLKNNNSYIITGSEKQLIAFDKLSGKIIYKAKGLQRPFGNGMITHDRKLMVDTFSSNKICITRLGDNKKLKTIDFTPPMMSTNIVISNDDKTFIIQSKDKILIFSIDGEKIYEIEKDFQNITHMKISDNDRYLFSISGSEVSIFDLKNKNKLSKINTNSPIIDPDIWKNKYLIISSLDKSITLWEITTNKMIGIFNNKNIYPRKLTISKDNKTLFVSFNDGTVLSLIIENILFNKKYQASFTQEIEKHLQTKLEVNTMVPSRIEYNKLQWSKTHPFYWIEKAEAGDIEAMYQLGIIYDRDGKNQKALDWYKKSAKKGHIEAKERIVFLEKWIRENKGKQ